MEFPHYRIWKLRDWVDPSRLDWEETIYENFVDDFAISTIEKYANPIDWDMLSSIPEAIPILEKNLDKINWNMLSTNSGAMHLLKNNPDKIHWIYLSKNPSAIEYLEENIDKVFWEYVQKNDKGASLLLKYPHQIDFEKKFSVLCLMDLFDAGIDITPVFEQEGMIERISHFSQNVTFLEKYAHILSWEGISQNPYAISILEKNIKKMVPFQLCKNPSAIHLIETYFDQIFSTDDPDILNYLWFCLCENKNAIHIIEKNLDKLKYDAWYALSGNPSAIHLLEANPDKVYYLSLSANSAIFELDYDFLRRRLDIFREELLMKALHPSRLEWILGSSI